MIELHKEGCKTGEIRKKSGVNQRIVQHILKKYHENGGHDVPLTSTSPGRPCIISKRGLRVLGRDIEINPILTARLLKVANPEVVAGASVRTIQRRLREDLNYSKVKARKKPLITAKQKTRLNFARSYKDWDLAKWRQVLWSDEASFFVSDNMGKNVRRKPTSDPLDPKYLAMCEIPLCNGMGMFWWERKFSDFAS